MVAVKRIDYKKWKVHNNGVSKQQLEAEFNIHAKLEHPNVVRMYSVFEGTEWIYVVLEMVSGGDLFDYLIQKAQHGVEEKVARCWFAQLLDGLQRPFIRLDVAHNVHQVVRGGVVVDADLGALQDPEGSRGRDWL